MNEIGVILAAHGAGDESSANAIVRAIAEEVAKTGRFAEVRPAFNLGTPSFAEALDAMTTTEVVVVPLMTSDGYFNQHILPRELARSERATSVDLRITLPVGMHPRIQDILSRQIKEALGTFKLDPLRTAVLLIGHGTRRNTQSRGATLAIQAALGQAISTAGVEAAFIDDDPTVEKAAAGLTGLDLLAVPFLVGGGSHAEQDIPRGLGLTQSASELSPLIGKVDGRTVVCLQGIGCEPELVSMVTDLATGVGPAFHPTSRTGSA